jgi:hypothetical protein
LLVPDLPGLGELGWRLSTKRAVGSFKIVFVTPVPEEHLRFEERVELLAVQELVAEPCVERFDPAVLPGLTGQSSLATMREDVPGGHYFFLTI